MKLIILLLVLVCQSTNLGGWGLAIPHVILKALLVDDALKLPSVTSTPTFMT